MSIVTRHSEIQVSGNVCGVDLYKSTGGSGVMARLYIAGNKIYDGWAVETRTYIYTLTSSLIVLVGLAETEAPNVNQV
jgi:hypothetical protein